MLQSFLIFTFVNLFLGQLCSAESKFGYEYKPEVDGWLRLNMVPATWADAAFRCSLEGTAVVTKANVQSAALASPTSKALSSVMVTMMAEKGLTLNMVYTGINAIIAKGDYMTIEGLPLSNISLDWAAGEPNNYENSEDCLVMNGVGQLADENCALAFAYFCFRKKVSLGKCGTLAPGTPDFELDPRTGSCYRFYIIARNWHRAALTCRAKNAHLAVINSDKEAEVLKELFAKHPTLIQANRDLVHIGFWDWQKQGDWQTILGQNFWTGRDTKFGRWQDHEPNNVSGKEFCGAMDRKGRLHDVSCDVRSAFICETHP